MMLVHATFQVSAIDPKWLVELAPRYFRQADAHKLSRRKRGTCKSAPRAPGCPSPEHAHALWSGDGLHITPRPLNNEGLPLCSDLI
jgi:hypothetical protein